MPYYGMGLPRREDLTTHVIDNIIDDINNVTSMKVEELAVDILNGLRIKNPVDTGFSRSNWHISKNTPNADIYGEYPDIIVPMQPVSVGSINYDIMRDRCLYIQNNVEYIQYLNMGWSPQAEEYFVENVVDAVFLHHKVRRK